MKRKDSVVIGTILLLLFMMFAGKAMISKDNGQYVKITKDDVTIGIYPLSKNDTYDLGSNILVVKSGVAYMEHADCPDKLCISQGKIKKVGESIICLPNRVVATVIKDMDTLTADGFYFNTYVSIVVNDSDNPALLDEAMNICSDYEKICSRTDKDSELYKLNHRLLPAVAGPDGNDCYQISDELYDMIKTGLEYSRQSMDVFNIAIAPVTELWDFTSGKNIVPEYDDVQTALKYTDSRDITLYDDNLIAFASDKNMIDLGGLAKGYIADRIGEHLRDNGVHSAIISLGCNILCIGDKQGEHFVIGIKKPFEENEIIDKVSVTDKSVVTSGNYERYFYVGDILFHHIIDTSTGFPVTNDLSSVTIVSDSSCMGDYLSTYLFSLGSEKAIEYDKLDDNIEVILVDRENKKIQD